MHSTVDSPGLGTYFYLLSEFDVPKQTALNRDYATIPQIAEYLGVDARTVRRYISEGVLPAYRVGPKVLRVDLNEVETLLVHAVQTPPPTPDFGEFSREVSSSQATAHTPLSKDVPR